jgi:hypothetical protein
MNPPVIASRGDTHLLRKKNDASPHLLGIGLGLLAV